MFKRLIVLLSLCLLPLAQAGAESGWQGDYASDIKVDTLYLDNNLSSADDTVQKALETIDSLTLGSFSGDADDIDEGTTHLFLTTDERTILSNTSGTNTGDQDLSGYLLATGATTGATSSAQTFTNGIIGNVTGNVSGSSGSCTGNAATVTNGVYTTDIGSTVQAYDADLTTWAGITPGANVGTFLATPSSANLSTAVTDETGSGALVFGTSPVFTTQITSPKIYNAGDMTIDAYNAASDSTVTITNSDGTYDANLSIDGDLTVKNILVQDGGVLQLGYDTVDGELRIYSEQGVTDYIAHLFANTAMTSAANFYLPADEPASTQFLTMTSGGAIGFDTLGFGALSDPDANTILGWDDTDGAMKTMTIGAGLSYDHATHTISSTVGATALDDIADPDAATSISTDDGENLTFLTAVDGENFLAIHQTAASVTASTYLLDLGYNADADTEADFILCRDDLDGTPAEMFKVEYNGDTTTAGNINAAALYTSSLNNGTSSNDITIDASGDDIWVVGGTNLQFGNASTNAGAIYLRNGALGGDPMVTMQMSTNDFAVTTDTGDINLVPTGGEVNVTGAVVVDAAGVKISSDGDGALTLLGLGDGFDESLTVNLDDTENTAVVSSATGVTKIDCGSIVLEGAFSSSDGTAGASATTGGLTFKDGLYTSGTATEYATKALDNLASVAINTSLVSDTDNTDDLGTSDKRWANAHIVGLGRKNLIINGIGIVNQRVSAYTLVKDEYGFGPDKFAGMATGTAVSAGTLGQTAAANCGRTGYGFKFSGVTLTGTGILYLRTRIESKDAIWLKNQVASFQAKVYHDVGSAINYTIYVKKADSADDFSSTTAIGNSGSISVLSATATTIKYESISMGDCSNGIEIEIKIECGEITTKNFELTEMQLEMGSKITEIEQNYHNNPIAPSITTLTSGSGTYTTPSGVKWIKVRMVGGGGGGGSSGTSNDCHNGGSGGNTSFGTTFLTAHGGSGGSGGNVGGSIPAGTGGGAGGTGGTIPTGATGFVLSGGNGGGYPTGTSSYAPGGMGGSSVFGGSGGNCGESGKPNTGGGGAGAGNIPTDYEGAGGGAGEYVEAIIAYPSTSYSYSVGAGGTGGAAGTNGGAGGNGGSGVIIIEEHYGY